MKIQNQQDVDAVNGRFNGFHDGFMKRILLSISQLSPLPTRDEDWLPRLQNVWAIQQESQHLWEELEVEEQEALLAFFYGEVIPSTHQKDDFEFQTFASVDGQNPHGVLVKRLASQRRLDRPALAPFLHINFIKEHRRDSAVDVVAESPAL